MGDFVPTFIADLDSDTDSDFEDRHRAFVDAIGVPTMTRYVSRVARYVAWLESQSPSASWADPEAVARYVSYRLLSAKLTTVQGDVSAISKACQYETEVVGRLVLSPRWSAVVTEAFDAATPTSIPASPGTLALTRSDLSAVLEAIDLDTNLGKRDAALLAVGWLGAIHASKLPGITRHDVGFVDQGIILTLRKANQNTTVRICGTETRWNPVALLQAWVNRIEELTSPTPDGLWLPINRGDAIDGETPIQRSAIGRLVSRRTTAVGLEGMTPASLRKGWLAHHHSLNVSVGGKLRLAPSRFT